MYSLWSLQFLVLALSEAVVATRFTGSVAAVQCGPVQKLGSDLNLAEPDPKSGSGSGWGLNRTQSPVPVRRWAKNGEPGPNLNRTRT